MVVEDDDATRYVLREALTDEGFSVITAHEPAEALQLLADHTPRLVLTDLLMPGADGLDLLAAIRARPEWAHIPVLVVSAMPHLDHTVKGEAVDGVLSKPFDLDDLLHKVRELLPAR